MAERALPPLGQVLGRDGHAFISALVNLWDNIRYCTRFTSPCFFSPSCMLQTVCSCDLCRKGVLSFYIDYLAWVKKLPMWEVNEKTQSQRRTIQWGNKILNRFVDTLFDSDATVTCDGDDLADIWDMCLKSSYFCDQQLLIWENQLKARKLIDE